LNQHQQKSVLLLGGGGHAKVLAGALQATGRQIIGVLVPDTAPGSLLFGIPVLGDDAYLARFTPQQIDLVNGLGSLPGQNHRHHLARACRDQGFSFATVIHPSAVVAADADIGSGVQIMAGCILQPGSRVGMDTIINSGSIIDHDCRIGDGCHIAPGCTLSGGVTVGNLAHLGTGTVVIQQITIGAAAIIGAGSVVVRDVPPATAIIQERTKRCSDASSSPPK